MPCEEYLALIELVDLLEGSDRVRLIAHARACDSCRRRLVAGRALQNVLRRAFHFAPPEGFWEGYHHSLQDATRSQAAFPADLRLPPRQA